KQTRNKVCNSDFYPTQKMHSGCGPLVPPRPGTITGAQTRENKDMGVLWRRKNSASHVYTELKHTVLNYRFAPGRPLHLGELAEQLKVSSTPIREALHRLEGEHLLAFIPNKGFFCKVLNIDEMRELSVLRYVLVEYPIAANVHGMKGDP